jgi:diguanylate cyclase (GGDEF)-like protein
VILDEMAGAQIEQRKELRLERKSATEEMIRNIIIAAVVSVVILIYLHLRLLGIMRLKNESERDMDHLASHDALTELPNRRLMLAHMEQALQRCLRNNKSMALMFLDLNGFKPVNDRYGHLAGDEVLKQVAHRLSGAMRASDQVARFGGDEFVVLIEDITDKEDVCGIVGKVGGEIGRPFKLQQGQEVTISASIGVAIYPRDGLDLESLLRNADTAMYAAKKSESNCYCKEQTQSRRCVLISDGER